ncbi:MAG: DUF2092 domain-containing protein [Chromatiales bacterium]|nr:hypothetical protein [uncultured bacterium]UCG73818.1 MAG: DUF2092 domain-containing protein [Chromatiales bacterium]
MKLRGRIPVMLPMMCMVAAPGAATEHETAVQPGDTVAEATDNPAIEAEALQIFKRMADYIASSEEYSYHAESSYDVVQPSGMKVEFGGTRKVLVSRPNRLRMDGERRDGVRGVLLFDSENIWMFDPDENVYATADQPDDLGASIEFAVVELSMNAPLADLLVTDVYDRVTANLIGALDLGETVVSGVVCDHLLMRNDYTDFQMWITTGDQPVLKRIVITYKEEPGEPQYRAQFVEWNMAPEATAARLDFRPPADAEQIRFYLPPPAAEQEDAS